MTFNPLTDLKPGDRVHDSILADFGIFEHYYDYRNGTRYAAVLFDGDERPMRIRPEDLTLTEE